MNGYGNYTLITKLLKCIIHSKKYYKRSINDIRNEKNANKTSE